MYKMFNALLGIIWVMDILDFPCVEFLDTTCPINFWAWILIFLIIPNANAKTINHTFKIKED